MRVSHTQLSLELCIEPHNRLADLILFLHAHRDSFASVQHRSMIPTPEDFSNFMQGGFGVAPSQIHRHLEILSTCDPPLAWRQQAHEVETRGPERNRDSRVAYCRDAGFRAHFMCCILYVMTITIDKEVIYISKGSHLFSTSPPYRRLQLGK